MALEGWRLACFLAFALCVGALPASQTNSLVALYNATSGSSWVTGWNLQDNPCTWQGVICDGAENNVEHLLLPGNKLDGTLPDLALPNLLSL